MLTCVLLNSFVGDCREGPESPHRRPWQEEVSSSVWLDCRSILLPHSEENSTSAGRRFVFLRQQRDSANFCDHGRFVSGLQFTSYQIFLIYDNSLKLTIFSSWRSITTTISSCTSPTATKASTDTCDRRSFVDLLALVRIFGLGLLLSDMASFQTEHWRLIEYRITGSRVGLGFVRDDWQDVVDFFCMRIFVFYSVFIC